MKISKSLAAGQKIFYVLLSVLSVGFLVFIWVKASNARPDMFPTIEATLLRFEQLQKIKIMKVSYLGHVWASLKRVFVALLLTWLIGISFGFLIGWNKKANSVLGSVYYMIRPIPPLAWIPLITIWFGIGEFPKILLITIGSLASVVINTQAGVDSCEKIYLNIGTVFNANRWQTISQIVLPAAIPAIFAGIKISISSAWMVVLAAEMLGASKGVGFLIIQGMNSNDLPLVLIAMITIGVIGALISVTMNAVERIVCRWN